MLIEAALAVEIHRTNPALNDETRVQYASWVVEEATARDLDPWVFHAIIHVETRWKAGIVVHEHDGTCSVGLGGINVACDSSRAKDLRDPHANIQAVGVFLTRIRRRCAYRWCSDHNGLGWLRMYNGGQDYVTRLVGPIVERCHAAYPAQSIVGEVQAEVHVPEL